MIALAVHSYRSRVGAANSRGALSPRAASNRRKRNGDCNLHGSGPEARS